MRGPRGWTGWAVAALGVLFVAPAPAESQQADGEHRHVVDAERAWATAAEKADRAELRRVARRAEKLDAALAGGVDQIVIPTTTLIIALLVLIILLLI